MFTKHVHRCSWNIAYVYDVSKCSSWCYNIAILDDHDTIVCSVCLNIGICYMVLQTWTISNKGTRGLLPPRRMFTTHVHRCWWNIAYVYGVCKCSSWCYNIVIFEYRDIIVCSLHMFIDVDEILRMFMMFLNVHPDAIILQY